MWRFYGKNMFDVCCVPSTYDEYIAMVKTRNECQLSVNMLLLGNFATAVCCADVSAYSRDLLTTASLDSRLHQSSKRVFPQHPCVESVQSCVVLFRVARTTLRGFWVHTSRTFSKTSANQLGKPWQNRFFTDGPPRQWARKAAL